MIEKQAAILEPTPRRAAPVLFVGSPGTARPDPQKLSRATAEDVTGCARGPRPWNQGEERQMLYAMPFFLGWDCMPPSSQH